MAHWNKTWKCEREDSQKQDPEGHGQEFGFLYVRCEDARGF